MRALIIVAALAVGLVACDDDKDVKFGTPTPADNYVVPPPVVVGDQLLSTGNPPCEHLSARKPYIVTAVNADDSLDVHSKGNPARVFTSVPRGCFY